MRNSSNSLRPTVLILLFFLIFVIIYSPVIYFNYLYHDDATLWVQLKLLRLKFAYFDSSISQCRFFSAWLTSLECFFIHKVSDLRFLRSLSILVSSVSAYLILLQMRKLSFSDINAFLVISAMFFLPGFAVFISCGEYSLGLAMSIFLACWSFHRIEKSQNLIVPIFSNLIAIMFYPPGAMTYWMLIGMYIIFVQDRYSSPFKNKILRFMAAGSLSLFIYAIFLFIMHFFYSNTITNPLYDPYGITADWINKLQWFAQEPMQNALNLWNIFPKAAASIIVWGFILFTALVTVIKKFKDIEDTQKGHIVITCLWQLGLLIFILFMTFLPNLMAQGNAPWYRCLIPLTSLIWFLLVWAIFQWTKILPAIFTRWTMIALLSALTVYAGIRTYHNVLWYRAVPSAVEWDVYRSMAQQIKLKNVDAIYVILPYPLTIERYDEFGTISSDYINDIMHLIYCAFDGTENTKQYSLPLVYASYPGSKVLTELKEFYITKLPDGKWIGRDINKDGVFHEIDHSILGNTKDKDIFIFELPHKRSAVRQNWYILNLNGLFSPSNFWR
jgi:hypothetical protein